MTARRRRQWLTFIFIMPSVIWKSTTEPSRKKRSQTRSSTFMCTTDANAVRNQCREISDNSAVGKRQLEYLWALSHPACFPR